jgi:glycosyltransferase involved in cell wall biosynthesis
MARVTPAPGIAAPLHGPPVAALRNGLFIAWKDECFRSRATARTFGCPIELLGAGGGRLGRYLARMMQTWRLLEQRRPHTVVCLNQPPLLPLVCALWTWRRGGAVIQDFHSGAFSHRRWRAFRGMYRRMTRQSPVTLAHNREDAQRLQAWHAPTALLLTLPGAPDPALRVEPVQGRPRLLFVCTFAADEPVHAALQAFAECPEVDVWVTGNYRKAGLSPEAMPAHVRLMGFVDYATYSEAMASSAAVVTLSDRPYIMQMAVEEAITMGVPVLTNQSPTLQEALGGAGVFVTLSPQGIAAGVREVVARLPALREAAACARERCWQTVDAELQALRHRVPELFE